MGAATEISVDSVQAAVLSEEDGIFTLKEEHTNGYEGFFLVDNTVSLCTC